MKKAIFLLFIVTVMLFGACDKKNNAAENATNGSADKKTDNDNYYVDLDELDGKVKQLISLDGFTIMDSGERNFTNMNLKYGFDSDSFYCIDTEVGFKLDFRTGFLGEYCDAPGCVHNYENYCKYVTDKYKDIVNTADGSYEFDYMEGAIYYTKKGEDRKEIYRNSYFNEYNEKYLPDCKTSMGGMIKGNTAYLNGTYWIQMLSLDTLEATKPIDCKSGILFWDAVGEELFTINNDFELIRYNMQSGESQKLADRTVSLMCAGEYVYFVQENVQENDSSPLYRLRTDGTGEPEKLIENASSQFYVSDSHIFYPVYAPEDEAEEENEEGAGIGIKEEKKIGDCGGVYMCDLDGKNPKELKLSFTYKDGTEYKVERQWVDRFVFSSCESIRYLFIMDNDASGGEMNENALFIVDKETGDVIPISLGVYYSKPMSSEPGRILTY